MTERMQARALLYRRIKQQLTVEGLLKIPREQRFAGKVGANAMGYVAFTSSAKQTSDAFWIEMSVGVADHQLLDMVAEWTRTQAGNAMFHANVANIGTPGPWWDVRLATEDDVPNALRAIDAAFAEHARPFLDRCGDPLYVASLIEARPSLLEREAEGLCVLYAHAGAFVQAADAFARFEAAVADHPSPSVRSILFIQGFRRHFGPQMGISG